MNPKMTTRVAALFTSAFIASCTETAAQSPAEPVALAAEPASPAPQPDLEARHVVLTLHAHGEGAIELTSVAVGVGPAPGHEREATWATLRLADARGNTLREIPMDDPQLVRAYRAPSASAAPDEAMRRDVELWVAVPLDAGLAEVHWIDHQSSATTGWKLEDALRAACAEDESPACAQVRGR